MQLINNSDANWEGFEFWYDDNGQAHRQGYEWGDDYTLESGNLIDDLDGVLKGYIL